MDNLIAAGKAKPMIVVMDNLNAVKPGESGAIFAARGLVPAPGGGTGMPGQALLPAGAPNGQPGRGGAPAGRGGGGVARPTFTEMMLADLIPAIERTYRALPGREN